VKSFFQVRPVCHPSLRITTVKVKVGTGKKAKSKSEMVLEFQVTGGISGATSLNAYRLMAGKTKKGVTKYTTKVGLASVSYNSSMNVVTLVPFRKAEPVAT
jgi:hypothetical protein